MTAKTIVSGCLYRLTFPSGKVYIGITKNSAAARFAAHVSFATTGKRLCAVHHAILKHGADSVRVETLAVVDDWQKLPAMEVEAIKLNGSKFPNGYNLTDGGEGTIGVIRSAEVRAKHSAAKKGRPLNKETMEKAWAASRGRVKTDAERAKISASHKGKKKSPEHIAKIADAQRGRTLSLEARAHLSALYQGRKFSEETRAKISAACAAKWADRKRAATLTT